MNVHQIAQRPQEYQSHRIQPFWKRLSFCARNRIDCECFVGGEHLLRVLHISVQACYRLRWDYLTYSIEEDECQQPIHVFLLGCKNSQLCAGDWKHLNLLLTLLHALSGQPAEGWWHGEIWKSGNAICDWAQVKHELICLGLCTLAWNLRHWLKCLLYLVLKSTAEMGYDIDFCCIECARTTS